MTNKNPATTAKGNTLPKAFQSVPKWLEDLLQATESVRTSERSDGDPEACYQEGIKACQAGTARFALAGWWFGRSQSLSGKGKQWLSEQAAKTGFSRTSTYDAIAVFKRFQEAPKQVVRTFGQLEYTKFLALRTFSNSDLEALARGDDVNGLSLDDVRTLSVRELKRRVQDATAAEAAWKRKVAKLEKEKALAQAEAEMYKARETPAGDLPESIQLARESGYVAGLKALDGLWEIEGLFNEIAKGRDISRDPDQAKREYDAGLPGLYVTIMTILASGSRLAQQLREHFSEYLPDLDDELDIPFLDDEESERIMKRFNSMLAISRPLSEKLTKREAKQRGRRK